MNSNSNSNSNDSSSKRKRRQRSSLSSSSSVSSVSSGGSDSSFNKSRRSKNNSNSKSKSNNYIAKSFFSGFWSDAEIEDNENNNSTTGSRNSNNSNSNNNSNRNRNEGNNEGRIYYEGFYLTIAGSIYEIGVGDVVAMRNSVEPVGHESDKDDRKRHEPMPGSEYAADTEGDKPSEYYKSPEKDAPIAKTKEAKLGDGLMLARVERIWQETTKRRRGSNSTSGTNTTNSNSSGKVFFQARWFLKKEDVDSLPLGELNGPISCEIFANNITEHDLVLSNQSDDNHVTTICDLVQGELWNIWNRMESNGIKWNRMESRGVEVVASHIHFLFISYN